jgi:hypothetical protein
VIASLLSMRIVHQAPRPTGKRVIHEMREGLAYVRSIPAVRGLLVLLAGVSVFGGASTSLLPAVAERSLAGGPRTLGWLMGAGGAGALVGALYLASHRDATGLDRLAARCGVTLGAGLVALEAVPRLWAMVPLLFVVGLSLIAMWTATNTYVQSIVDDDKLGRVMSLYATIFLGGAPIGALLVGAVATAIGPIHALALAGAGCIAFASWFIASAGRRAGSATVDRSRAA